MKSIFFLAAAGSTVLVAAQNLTGEPSCAIPCLSSAIAAVCTPASDQGCACASQGAIGQAAVSCLLSGCNASDLTQAQNAGAQLCIDYSATATGVASTTAATSSSAVMTSPATTSSGSGSTSSTTGSGASSTRSSSTTTGSAASASASATGSTVTSASASATSTAGAQSVQGGLAAQAGVLGALLAGVVALL